jgi:AcrR family transcriptional regulator
MSPEAQRTAPLASAADRRRQQRDDARGAILEATESILVEEGYESFSMRKLAARCGYTAPTIYHYFDDKVRLFEALIELRLSDLVVELEEASALGEPVADMRATGLCFAYFGLRNPAHYRLMMTPRPDAEPLASGERARALLEAPLIRLERAGRLLIDDLDTAKQSFWALLHGLISLQLARPDVEWKEDIVEGALDALIRGTVRPEVAR